MSYTKDTSFHPPKNDFDGDDFNVSLSGVVLNKPPSLDRPAIMKKTPIDNVYNAHFGLFDNGTSVNSWGIVVARDAAKNATLLRPMREEQLRVVLLKFTGIYCLSRFDEEALREMVGGTDALFRLELDMTQLLVMPYPRIILSRNKNLLEFLRKKILSGDIKPGANMCGWVGNNLVRGAAECSYIDEHSEACKIPGDLVWYIHDDHGRYDFVCEHAIAYDI